MTSSIFWERTARGAWAPSTQPMASTTLDLPLPFGPTTTVTPGSSSRAVVSAKDLKPFRVRVLRNIRTRTSVVAARPPEHLRPGRPRSSRGGLLAYRTLATGARQRRQGSPSRP